MEHLTWHRNQGFCLVRCFGSWKGGPAGLVSARCWVLRGQTFCLNPLGLLSFPRLGLREGYRPYFENYTVDASIFGPTFGLVHEDDLKDH